MEVESKQEQREEKDSKFKEKISEIEIELFNDDYSEEMKEEAPAIIIDHNTLKNVPPMTD